MPAKSPVYKTVVEVTLLTTYEDVAHGTLEEMISEAASGEAVLGYTVTECYAQHSRSPVTTGTKRAS